MPDPENTRPNRETRATERQDAETRAAPDRAPTPEEEAIADELEPDESTREHYEEMTERGAEQEGEGRVP